MGKVLSSVLSSTASNHVVMDHLSAAHDQLSDIKKDMDVLGNALASGGLPYGIKSKLGNDDNNPLLEIEITRPAKAKDERFLTYQSSGGDVENPFSYNIEYNLRHDRFEASVNDGSSKNYFYYPGSGVRKNSADSDLPDIATDLGKFFDERVLKSLAPDQKKNFESNLVSASGLNPIDPLPVVNQPT